MAAAGLEEVTMQPETQWNRRVLALCFIINAIFIGVAYALLIRGLPPCGRVPTIQFFVSLLRRQVMEHFRYIPVELLLFSRLSHFPVNAVYCSLIADRLAIFIRKANAALERLSGGGANQ